VSPGEPSGAAPEPFIHTLRVRYGECDVQGVVFNSHYLAYFDVSLTELWRAALGGYQVMLDRGIDVVVAEAQVRFRGSARFDQELTLEMAIAHLGNTSIVSRHRIAHGGRALVEGTMVHVTVDRNTLAKRPIPDWLRGALSPWLVEEGQAARRPP
jgi:acyl-CoA thioester hydrolase